MNQTLVPNQLLAIQKRRAEIIDWTFVALLVAIILAVAALAYQGQMSWIATAVTGLIVGYPVNRALQPLAKWVTARFAPGWVIEECDGVIKVHGEVTLDQWGQAERAMLSRRTGYMPVVQSWKEYGCTMACVPATPAYLQGMQKLAAMGIHRMQPHNH